MTSQTYPGHLIHHRQLWRGINYVKYNTCYQLLKTYSDGGVEILLRFSDGSELISLVVESDPAIDVSADDREMVTANQ